jgi:hypothetical protein
MLDIGTAVYRLPHDLCTFQDRQDPGLDGRVLEALMPKRTRDGGPIQIQGASETRL